jgi:hypothetical protein
VRALPIDRHLASGNTGDQVEDLPQGDACASSNIVDAPGHAADGRVGRGLHRIGHEREIAGLQAVAELHQRLTVEHRREEPVETHIRTLPRSVHREVAQRHGGDLVVHEIQMTELLGRQLGDAVGRDRLRQRGLDHRDRHVVAIDRGARGVHQPLDRAADTGLEQPLRRVDVETRVDLELCAPAAPDAGLRGKVKDVRDAVE